MTPVPAELARFRLKNKPNELSRYAFSCGYIQSWQDGEYKVSMWQEHSCFHVSASAPFTETDWTLYETIGEARRQFALLVRERKANK